MNFGLIGYPLGHSYSKSYFTQKFQALGLTDFFYRNYEVADPDEIFPVLHSNVFGLNVTRPYKSAIIPFLNEIDRTAWEVGAVNTLVRTGPWSWKGYNTDVPGFRDSLLSFLGSDPYPSHALILGSGGAARAVEYVLHQLGIEASIVSRDRKGKYRYTDLTRDIIMEHTLIIHTTPLGTAPDVEHVPPIPYEGISSRHMLFDLVYNPSNTLFLTRGQQVGARTKNGLDMLHLQAEHAWAIWKSYGKF